MCARPRGFVLLNGSTTTRWNTALREVNGWRSAGRGHELLELGLGALEKLPRVLHQIRVCLHPDVHVVAVAEHRDVDPHADGQRAHRDDVFDARTGHVQLDGRTGDIRHD